jgi:DNA modification methylase
MIPLEPMWEQLKRIIKPNGAIVMTASQPFTTTLIASNMKMFRYCWVWKKSKATNFLNAKKQPLRKHEDICVFYKKPPTYKPQMTKGDPYTKGIRKNQLTGSYGDFSAIEVKSEDGMRYPTDVVYFKTAESEGAVLHSTQKPVALMEYLIKTYTNEGETVLDFTMGSGSTGVACKNLNRKFIGIELDEEYFKIAQDRISAT